MTLLHFYSVYIPKHFTYDVKSRENELFCSFCGAKKETRRRGAFRSPKKRFWLTKLNVVMSQPLSRAHLTSSEAKLDGWGWNEVCKTLQVILFKNTFLSENLFRQYIIDCSSALHLCLVRLTWLRLTMAANVKLMTGLASVWEFD